MGPQLDSCGRPIRIAKERNDSGLQWGRNLTVAEGDTLADELDNNA